MSPGEPNGPLIEDNPTGVGAFATRPQLKQYSKGPEHKTRG